MAFYYIISYLNDIDCFDLLESWQQIKQDVAGTSTAAPAATPAVTPPVRPYYPMKRFVKSQENRTGDDDSDDSPICQRIYDLVFDLSFLGPLFQIKETGFS